MVCINIKIFEHEFLCVKLISFHTFSNQTKYINLKIDTKKETQF